MYDAEALEQVDKTSCRCLIPGQARVGLDELHLVCSISFYSKVVGVR